MVTYLDELLEGRKAGGFSSVPHYFKDGDYITLFLTNERCYASRVDDLLTVYYSDANGDFVGCKVKGVRDLLENLRHNFKVTVDDGEVRLGWLFLCAAARSSAPSREKYYWLGERVGSVALTPEQLPLAA
jgi:hypothetical protein